MNKRATTTRSVLSTVMFMLMNSLLVKQCGRKNVFPSFWLFNLATCSPSLLLMISFSGSSRYCECWLRAKQMKRNRNSEPGKRKLSHIKPSLINLPAFATFVYILGVVNLISIWNATSLLCLIMLNDFLYKSFFLPSELFGSGVIKSWKPWNITTTPKPRIQVLSTEL